MQHHANAFPFLPGHAPGSSSRVGVRGPVVARAVVMAFQFAAARLTSPGPRRLKPENVVHTNDFMNVMEEWLRRKVSRNMCKFVACLGDIPWRTQPMPNELLPIIDLNEVLLALTSVP